LSTIKNIVFDLGGVLIDWDPRYVYRTIFDTEEEVEEFLANVCLYEWNIQQDAGRSLQEATEILIRQHPKWTTEIRAYYSRWEEMLGGVIEGTLEILETFIANPNYKVYALTNWSAETFPIAEARYEFLQWFEGVVVSGVEKCIKPNPKIYKILFERYGLNPEECIFIDDNEANIAASRNLGMPAIHFQNPATLKTELARLHLLEV